MCSMSCDSRQQKSSCKVPVETENFFVNWENACCGIVKTKTVKGQTMCYRITKGGFAIRIVGMVEAGPLTGFQANVLRKVGDKKRRYAQY